MIIRPSSYTSWLPIFNLPCCLLKVCNCWCFIQHLRMISIVTTWYVCVSHTAKSHCQVAIGHWWQEGLPQPLKRCQQLQLKLRVKNYLQINNLNFSLSIKFITFLLRFKMNGVFIFSYKTWLLHYLLNWVIVDASFNT